ncbi:hypothetical protein [Clostridium estertheticum]|uniref:hypothetical protein n=1 Tax=Clostridium estertheticum TaxID=238834 RepID=UPI001C0C6019|nr:hypothetical protein [Clostridium estertheticum]MBU3073855.1 hypothetical protein [Clostridium estertheticum]MBU3163950.1 hypothetical protein [Clostridium estertheticum]
MKASGICNRIKEKSNQKPSYGHPFVLKMFIAGNLGLYMTVMLKQKQSMYSFLIFLKSHIVVIC